MKSFFSKKIILVIIIFGLAFSPLMSVFTPQAEAQYGYGPATPGAAVGQALAAGAACFLAARLENFVAGLAEKLSIGLGEGHGSLVLFPEAVPVNALSAPGETAKIQTGQALIASKDCIRDVVVKMIIDWLVDSTVEWIQNGGEPRFVTNWDSFLSDAFNVGVGEIINKTSLAFLCEPFGLQVRLALLPVERFQYRITCTLDDIVANIEDFYGDFRQGGWVAYQEQWWPENNFYGTTLMAISEAQAEGARRQQAAEKEALAGRGFIGVKRCIYEDYETGECLEYEIVTPGEVVGEVTAKAITSDWEWAANVKSWTAAIVNAAINRLFKEGLSAMKKSVAPRQSDYGGDYNTGVLSVQLSSLAPQLQKEQERIIKDYQSFQDYFNAILNNKRQSLSAEQQILTILNDLKSRNCQPAVTDEEIAAAQKEISRLLEETVYYQTAVEELNTNLAAAQNIKNFTDREITLLNQNYNDFRYKYQDLIQEITTASETTKKTTLEETQVKQNELALVQSRLAICLITTP